MPVNRRFGDEPMRISELSDRSGRSIPTIKYYLREGLLPPGRRTAANQAEYFGEHLHRLRLITTLLDTGGLPIATVRTVLTAIDDDALSLHEVLGVAHHSLALRSTADADSHEVDEAQDEIAELLDALGWIVKADAPARRELAATLVALRRLGWNVGADVFARYARAADELAAWELSQTPPVGSRAVAVEAVVVGTVVFEGALLALRRLAEEHHSAMRNAPIHKRQAKKPTRPKQRGRPSPRRPSQ
ncbi:MAG: MerR family transcriptional regulator [Acidimicrobiales bacterium]